MPETASIQASVVSNRDDGSSGSFELTSRSRTTIKAGVHAMIRLPSEGLKIVELKSGGIISLGKFGSFSVDEVLGFQFGQSFEIIGDNKVVPIKSLDSDLQQEEDAVEDVGELTQEGLTTMFSNSAEHNQNIIDIGSKIQKLSNDDIDELKKSGASSQIGQLIIQKMIEGHEGFDKKTIYSQQKYLKRKQQKFLRRFTIECLGSSQLLQYYIEKDLQKVLDMSEESLSLLLTYANIRPGGKYLLLDETSGVVLYAMLERMNMQGQIVLIHENEHINNSALRNTDISEAELDEIVKPINWLQFVEPENERIAWEDLPEAEIDEMKQNKKSQYYKRRKRAQDINSVISLVEEGNFDGLVCVTTLDLNTVMPFIIPRLGGSRPIVAYSQFKEVLLEAQHSLQVDKRILAPSIFETRVRQYQTIPGRMHPLMTIRGFGGYVLWATRVLPKEGGVQAVGRGLSKKRNERSAEPEAVSEASKKPKVAE